MSIPLPVVNLAGISVGQSGVINLAQLGISAGGVSADPSLTKGAGTLHIFNESGSGLQLNFQTSGDGFNIPAGGWTNAQLKPGEQGLEWTVLYNLPNPPVTLLLVTYYGPNEVAPNIPQLGNSPIGIGGTVNTSSVNTLSNESNSSTTLVIDIGQVGHTLLVTINSDGSALWSVLQGSVAHAIFAINNTGTPLQIGQLGDFTEVLGKLFIDQNTDLDNGAITTDGLGTMTFNNSKFLRWKDVGGTARNIFTLDNANNFQIAADSGGGGGAKIYFLDGNGSQIAFMNNLGISLTEGAYGFLTGSISRVSVFSGVGTGTYNHNLGATPDFIALTTHANGSQTMGYDSENSTNVHVTCGSGLAFIGLAIKG